MDHQDRRGGPGHGGHLPHGGRERARGDHGQDALQTAAQLLEVAPETFEHVVLVRELMTGFGALGAEAPPRCTDGDGAAADVVRSRRRPPRREPFRREVFQQDNSQIVFAFLFGLTRFN